jgi:hypothetical protein
VYQLEYLMKTPIKSALVRPSAAAAAVLAVWFTLGSSQIARAEEAESLSAPAQEMILVPAKDVQALEKRIAYLEETVTALTESWQHIDTHRLCVSDDSGAETCITKAQLDVFLGLAQINEPAVSQEAKAAPPAEPVEIVAAAPASEPATAPVSMVGENLLTEPDPESTGTVTTSEGGGAVLPSPKLEIYEEPTARSED